MSKVKDLYYDIETLFIEGQTASEIAKALDVPLEQVQDVLDDFGVPVEDLEIDAEDWDEIEAFDTDDYYGA
jgi:hypothetical protein